MDLPARVPSAILNLKYRRFCVEYLQDFNGARAAETVGIDPARVSMLLKNWRIVTMLSELSKQMLAQPVDTIRLQVRNEYMKIGFGDPTEVEYRDKLTALAQLAKYTELIKETPKVNVNILNGSTVTIDILNPPEEKEIPSPEAEP